MNLEQILEEYGLSERKAKIYLAALELGESGVSEIAQKAQIRRSGTYYLIESLVEEGLFYRTHKGDKRFYKAVEPKTLLEMAEHRHELIQKNIGALQMLSKSSTAKPTIHVYEGIEGIKRAYEKMLLKKNAKMYAFSPFSTAEKQIIFYGKEYVKWGLEYIKKRAHKNIFVYDIAEDSPEARERQAHDEEELRETRLISKQNFPLTNEIDIFENTITIISYKELTAITIESRDIAFTLKSIFKLSWSAARKDLE